MEDKQLTAVPQLAGKGSRHQI